MKDFQYPTIVAIPTTGALGASACGHTFGMSAWGSAFDRVGTAGIDTIARDRVVAALVKGAHPGTSVWRPPSW